MAQQPAGFQHVPSLAELGQRLRDTHGEEAAARWAATGAALDLPDAAAYAVHQLDLARSALAAVARDGGPDGLTARETQVLGLVAEGVTTREISERLFISPKTADNHIQHIYTKLGVTNRAAATRWAMEHGLVESAQG
jgi:DNA-binding CsgD family transcriptional regulator